MHDLQPGKIKFQTVQAGPSQQNRIKVALAQFFKAGRHVAPDVFQLHIAPVIKQLSFAASRRSSDNSIFFQLEQLIINDRFRAYQEPVCRVFTIGNTCENETLRLRCRHVFH